MLKRRLKLLGKILLVFVVLFVVFLLFERVRGQIALAGYKRELIRIGEKLSPEDFRSNHSEADNGAQTVSKAIMRLKEGDVIPKHFPPRMRLTDSGHAIVGFRESEWVDDKMTNRWDQLAADLSTNEATLSELRTALGKPILNNNLDLAQGMKMQFDHLLHDKTLASWFASGAQLALREGRLHDASRELVVEIGVLRLLADDRLAISELVRIATAAIAKTDTWEALQADGWINEDLIALQKAWEEQVFVEDMAHSLEGERVFCDSSAEQMRASNDDTIGALFGPGTEFVAAISGNESENFSWATLLEHLPCGDEVVGFVREQVYCRVWRFAWSHQAQHRTLAQLQRLIELNRSGTKDRSYKDIKPRLDMLLLETGEKDFYDRLRYPEPDSLSVLSRTLLKAMRAETDRSLTICAIALKRHFLRHGKHPQSLDALVPEFLISVPIDYMDGQPVKYRLNADGSFTLYSVGEDGKDDSGDTTQFPDRKIYRDLWSRRDFVWPSPALPEEAEAFRKESSEQ